MSAGQIDDVNSIFNACMFMDSCRSKDAEIDRLSACLKTANAQAERFERLWYLRGDEIESALSAQRDAEALEMSHGEVIERLRGVVAEWDKLRDPVLLHANLLRGFPATLDREQLLHLIGGAPVAIMDTRTSLGLCAPSEEDFPALYALQGHRVALVDLGPNVRVQPATTAKEKT